MPAVFHEWLNLLVRWVHVIAAIMWIGDSFLFMWLDSHLSKPREGRDENVTGELWMTHSGGFYEVMKRKSLRKGEAVGTIYWFKWESYTTFLSGFLLLAIVYWLGGAAMLVDKSVSSLTGGQAVHLSLGLIPFGYLVYEGLWATPLKHNQKLFGVVGLGLIVGLAYALTHLLAGRAAFLQVGAMLGSIMTMNVFFRIIPAQRHMLAATAAGTPVDTSYGLRAKGRSIQNHYLTLPVLFCMLSSHFPSTYGHPEAWAVLGLMFMAGAALKYTMNFRGKAHPVIVVGGAMALMGAVVMTTQTADALAGLSAYKDQPHVSFATVSTIVQSRCVSCHSAHPVNPMFPAPPNGIMLDTPEQLESLADRVFVRAVATKTMPLGNLTGMTDDERALLGAWIAQGKDVHATGGSVVAAVVPDAGAANAEPEVDKSPAGLARHRYKNVCQVCHGEKGDAQTPSAAAFVVKPRNFTDAAWQSATSDEQLRTIILKGGAAVGKSATMPPNQDLEGKPEVVDALVKIVRGFGPAQP
ncbi:MAG: urate hydroxylase PuuD [Archangiaceae bacterium]|nr:urate hydroxylase PuuD [Archangiaceae bacterium]